jgi:hypothetical protein
MDENGDYKTMLVMITLTVWTPCGFLPDTLSVCWCPTGENALMAPSVSGSDGSTTSPTAIAPPST